MGENQKIRVGSRKSELALIQTKHVISLLKELNPKKDFEIVTMSTLGDQVLDIPLPKIGEKALFTKELETALATGDVDFVVHSLKDLPTCLPEGMAIGAVLTREDPRDALVLQKDLGRYSLETLPNNSVIGTSSLRRTAQLSKKYPHLIVENIRGNLNTRLKKLDDLGKYHAIILATAGLVRIGWKERISKILSPDEILYAVGQGALAVECRENDTDIIKLLEPLYDIQTALRITAERSFLKTLGGGCSAPVAVSSEIKYVTKNEFEIQLNGAVWSLDGKDELQDHDNISIFSKNGMRCATCPYNDKKMAVGDIESLGECATCPGNQDEGEGPSQKKPKLNIPVEILKNDPHDKCPFKIPVGADFMGQCPYLDGSLLGHENIIKDSEDQAMLLKKCPFLNNKFLSDNESNLNSTQSSSKSEDSSNLFCGLVPHKDAVENSMEHSKKLGERLAHSLISKGALEIMSKASSTIHS